MFFAPLRLKLDTSRMCNMRLLFNIYCLDIHIYGVYMVCNECGQMTFPGNAFHAKYEVEV